MTALSLARHSVPSSPRLGAVLEVLQLLFVLVIKHLDIAVWLAQILKEEEEK